MQKTPNLSLNKPEGTDVVNIEDLNANADILDAKLGTSGHSHNGTAGNGPKITAAGLAAGAANDTAIGNRTITDTVAAASGAGTLTNLLSKVGYMIKNITGKSNWYTLPAITLETIYNLFGISGHSHNGTAGQGPKIAYTNITGTPTSLPANGGTSAACSGNAATATKLATARTISLAGAVAGSGSFNGSTNLSITTTGVLSGTSATAAATAAKTVTLSSFALATGVSVLVAFTNGNTVAGALTLNVNSTGAKTVYHEDGNAVSATYPAYFPASAQIEFIYNGTGWIFKKRIVTNYVNGVSWYRVWSDGWIEQGGRYSDAGGTYTFLKPFKNTDYMITSQILIQLSGTSQANFNWMNGMCVYNLTTTSFTYGSFNTGAGLRGFYACGY